MGHVVGSGGPMYFPLLYLLKEPIPTLIIVIVALLLACWWFLKKFAGNPSIKKAWHSFTQYLDTNFSQFSLASFVILYWGYSVQSPLNIGLRHVIPTLPFIAILASGVWKKWITTFDFSGANLTSMASFAAAAMRSLAMRTAKYLLLILLLLWLLIETLVVSPNFLSYFNEFGGGTMNGYRFVTDSNYDWGQDLLRLQEFVSQYGRCVDATFAAHYSSFCATGIGPADQIAVDYFGGGNPAYALGANEVDWSSSKGNPALQGIRWLAVSVNTLEGATQPLGPGQTRNASDTYAWLTALRPPQPGMGNVPPPDYRVGTSIFVYHL
jgi:hypothetical protein